MLHLGRSDEGPFKIEHNQTENDITLFLKITVYIKLTKFNFFNDICKFPSGFLIPSQTRYQCNIVAKYLLYLSRIKNSVKKISSRKVPLKLKMFTVKLQEEIKSQHFPSSLEIGSTDKFCKGYLHC